MTYYFKALHKGYEMTFKHLYDNNVLTPSRVRVWRAKLKETVINSEKYAYKRNQFFILEVIYINKSEELLKLVAKNPDLPVVPMVDSEVCDGDEYGYWLGEFGRSEVGGEYAGIL